MLQPRVGVASVRLGQTVNPEKSAAGDQFALHALLGELDVAVEAPDGFWFQLSSRGRSGCG
jgi:hypothetical protein